MEKQFADVIVDITSEKLDRTFQYRIPGRLSESIRPGVVVLIPFGNGSRTIRGYVIQVTDRPSYPVEKMKEILDVEEGQNSIESRLIALAAWIRENYGSTMIQALKTVLPVKQKMKKRQERWISLGISREEAAGWLEIYRRKHHVARERLLEAVMEQEPLSYSLAVEKLHVTAQVVRAMEDQGVLRIHTKNGIPESCRGIKGRAGKDHTDFAAAEDGGGYPGRMEERGSAALPDPGSDRKRKDPGVYGADRTGAFSGKTGDLSDPGDRSDLSDGAALLPKVWRRRIGAAFQIIPGRAVGSV